MVEQATGLPVSEGEFQCDYATRPMASAMRLDLTAVDFYETNCVGCTNRQAADVPPHLGSYADGVAAILAAELRHGEDQRRARAANATLPALRGHPELVGTLLPSILDGLTLADRDRYSMSHPTARLQICLALALSLEPEVVDGKIAMRWQNATAAYRERLLHGYQRALDEDNGVVPTDGAVAAALSRASVVLTEAIPPLAEPLNNQARDAHSARTELQRTAAEIVRRAAELPGSSASRETLLGILMLLVQRKLESEAVPPSSAADTTVGVFASLPRER
jgi:hypothetical protein